MRHLLEISKTIFDEKIFNGFIRTCMANFSIRMCQKLSRHILEHVSPDADITIFSNGLKGMLRNLFTG